MKSLGSKMSKLLGVVVIFLGCIFVCSAIIGIGETISAFNVPERQNIGASIFAFVACAVIAFFLIRGGRRLIIRSRLMQQEVQSVKADIQVKENSIIDDVSMIDGMDGHAFEYFCADLLKKNGFTNVEVTKGSGDQGVDILAAKGGVKYAIQCKNYASRLGNTPIQEVNAGKTFYNCHVGVVMTNSMFTPAAKELANATKVLLWDRDVLEQYIKQIV